MKKTSIVFILILSISSLLLAQDPCTNPNSIGLLREGRTLKARCDSLFVLSKFKYFQMLKSEKYFQDLSKNYKTLALELEEKNKLMDSHINQLNGFIEKQDLALTDYRSMISKSDTLIVRSTKNTDRALEELKKSRIKTIIFTTLGVISGGALGYVIGNAGD